MFRSAIFLGTLASFLFICQTHAQTPAGPNTNDPNSPIAATNDPAQLNLLDSTSLDVSPSDCELRQLQKARLRAAVTEGQLRFQQLVEGSGSIFTLFESAQRILVARMALANGPWEQLAIRRHYLEFMRAVEALAIERFNTSASEHLYLERARYHRLNAELQVLRYPGYTMTERNMPVPPAMMESRPMIAARPESEDTKTNPLIISEFVQAPRFVIDMGELPSTRLPKQLANSAMDELELRTQQYIAGRGYHEMFVETAQRARDRRLELADSRAARIAILTQFRDFQLQVYETEKARYSIASVAPHVFAQLQYEVLCAEIDLARNTTPLFELQGMATPFPPPDWPPYKVSLFEDADEDGPEFIRSKTYAVDESEPKLRWMPKARHNQAIVEISSRYNEFRVGRGTLDIMFDSARRTLAARLDLLSDPAQRLQVLTEYRDFLLAVEDLNQRRFDVGAIRQQDLESTRFERLSAEIELIKAKRNLCAVGHVIGFCRDLIAQ